MPDVRIRGNDGTSVLVERDGACWWFANRDDGEGTLVDPRALPLPVVTLLGASLGDLALALAARGVSLGIDVDRDAVRRAWRAQAAEARDWRAD